MYLKSVLIREVAFGKKDFIRGGGTNVLYFCNISFKIINTTSGSKQQNIELYCIYYLLCHKQVINKTIKHINAKYWLLSMLNSIYHSWLHYFVEFR